MSYEGDMLERLRMPDKTDVAQAVLRSLFYHNGTIKAFTDNEDIVVEIANEFELNEEQRTAELETVYRKENRIKKANLWNRLLFRAADVLAVKQLVSRPSDTAKLTGNKEWMLTELGYDTVLKQLHMPKEQKENLPVRSYEVQKIVKTITAKPCPKSYSPIEQQKKSISLTTKEVKLRRRGFRQAVIEAYDFRCAICGLKLHIPLTQHWEVEAAHIVPHSVNGKDDVWNGIALCHFHHWAFDVGWFAILDDFQIIPSKYADSLDAQTGVMHGTSLFERFLVNNVHIQLPSNRNCFPHVNSLTWHRENIFAG